MKSHYKWELERLMYALTDAIDTLSIHMRDPMGDERYARRLEYERDLYLARVIAMHSEAALAVMKALNGKTYSAAMERLNYIERNLLARGIPFRAFKPRTMAFLDMETKATG